MDTHSLSVRLRNIDENERLFAVEDIIAERVTAMVPELVTLLEAEQSRIVREAIVEALKNLDISESYPQIAAYFESSDAFVRNCAIEIFGGQGETVVPFLISIMDHSNKEVRKLILDSLIATESEYCVPALRAALHDPAPNVQITAVEYLGSCGDSGAVAEVMELMTASTEPMLKTACLAMLGVAGSERDVDATIQHFSGNDGEIDGFYKLALVTFVGEKGSGKHLQYLCRFLNNKNLYCVQDILSAILRILRRGAVCSLGEETLHFIASLAKNSDATQDARHTALDIIGECDSEKSGSFFEDICNTNDTEIVLHAFEIWERLDRAKAKEVYDRKLKVCASHVREELMQLHELFAE